MNKKMIAASVAAGLAISLGSMSGAVADDRGGRESGLSIVLGDLVKKGTLTSAQVDEIKKAMGEMKNAARAADDARHAAKLKVITDTLGITEAELTSRLKAGETLAAIAGANKDALINALITFQTKQIDEAAAAGKLTADQATKLKANLSDRVISEVEKTKGPRDGFGKGMGMGKKEGKGPGHKPRP